ncbi:MAG: VCBS repeat-containing protein [Sedimentisphaerales bacterium]|nr:VCBS repeat-containing protein [Sedimentisphaerales bacterium]
MNRAIFLTVLLAAASIAARAYAGDLLLRLGPEELVQAGGADISVLGYSVPSLADWDNDGLNDLIVGEGSGSYIGKVRIYINTDAASKPQFTTFFYAQANGADLACTGSGCMGCFPRVVYWDADAKKDLLVGQSDGTVKIFLNVGSDSDPNFDAGTFLKVGPAGSKTNIDVGSRATPCVVDWNNDGKKDLAVGEYDAKIRLFINEGTDAEPDFLAESYAVENTSSLVVPALRSSPDILDLDGDGKKDILAGNTNGQLLFYSNKATDAVPSFAGYQAVEAVGAPIYEAQSRSRPSVCDWTGDGYPDVLIGAGDGKVHLYQTIMPGDMDRDHNVQWDDFATLALYWGATDCSYCSGADFFDDDKIDMLDVLTLAQHWLEGCK